jgi:hypothetical protein
MYWKDLLPHIISGPCIKRGYYLSHLRSSHGYHLSFIDGSRTLKSTKVRQPQVVSYSYCFIEIRQPVSQVASGGTPNGHNDNLSLYFLIKQGKRAKIAVVCVCYSAV